MSAARRSLARGGRGAGSGAADFLSERKLRKIIDNVLRLGKSTGAEETEVHVDEVEDSLTRFANNAIHQNVAERGLTVSVRTVVDGRTARATTNRVDEDSLRGAIEASLSLAHSGRRSRVNDEFPPALTRIPRETKFLCDPVTGSARLSLRP